MLSMKLARRARPPLGVCQPQGLVLPLTSTVDRMRSLSGASCAVFGAVAPVSVTHTASARADATARRDANTFMRSDLRFESLDGLLAARDTQARGEFTRRRSRASRQERVRFSWVHAVSGRRYLPSRSRDATRRPEPACTTRTSKP